MKDPYVLIDTRQFSNPYLSEFLLEEIPTIRGFYVPRWGLHVATFLLRVCYAGESVLLIRKCVKNPALVEAVISAHVLNMNEMDLLAMIRDWKS